MMSRRGHSLVEMMVVTAVLGILLPVISMAFATVYQIDASVRSDLAATNALLNLELQLRRDIHAASGATAQGPDLQLLLPGDVHILWTINATSITRDVISGGNVAHREAWPLPRDSSPVWSSGQQNGVTRITLQLDPRTRFLCAVGRQGLALAEEAQP